MVFSDLSFLTHHQVLNLLFTHHLQNLKQGSNSVISLVWKIFILNLTFLKMSKDLKHKLLNKFLLQHSIDSFENKNAADPRSRKLHRISQYVPLVPGFP